MNQNPQSIYPTSQTPQATISTPFAKWGEKGLKTLGQRLFECFVTPTATPTPGVGVNWLSADEF